MIPGSTFLTQLACSSWAEHTCASCTWPFPSYVHLSSKKGLNSPCFVQNLSRLLF